MFKEKASVLDYFRKKPDPKELVRKWQADLRAEQRGLERQIRDIERDRKTAEKQVRDAAKRGDMASAKLLAKEIVHTKKVIGRLYTNKAHMISMNSQLAQQLGTARVAGTLSKSTEVMKLVNDLIKVPQLQATMSQMSREMLRAGMIDEAMGDALDEALDTEAMEEETEAEVDKVLLDIAGETMAQLAASSAPKQAHTTAAALPAAAATEEDDGDLQARLDAVRS